jgi:hypothetical protein
MNCSRSRISILFSKSVVLSKIVRFLFTTTFVSCCSISITLHHASTIVCTFVACYTFNCTNVDSCSSFAIMFFSLVFSYIVYAFTKCYSSASSSFNFSMHIRSNDVAPLVCSFVHRCHLLLRKNSTTNVPIISMF